MSMADLHDLAAKLHDHEETVRREGRLRPAEFDLLAQVLLEVVHELARIDERLTDLASKSAAD